MSSHLCISIFVSQDPLQNPCLRLHVSASLYLRILCKTHVYGFMSQHPFLRTLYKIHVFGFMSQHLCISGSCARPISSASCRTILCKIHVSGFMSQHLCISGSSTRSMSPDSYLSIFISQDPLRDPCLRIHVSDSCLSSHQRGSSARSMSPDSCLSIFAYQDPLQDPCLRIHVSTSSYLRILRSIAGLDYVGIMNSFCPRMNQAIDCPSAWASAGLTDARVHCLYLLAK